MPVPVHHALLGLAVVAVLAAALRVASLLAPAGLARLLAAAPLAGATAVAQALLLGLAGLGGSTIALSLTAAATWVAVRVALPTVSHPALGEAATWWRDRSRRERAVLGALAGAGLAWAAWELRHPVFGIDSEFYHLPEIVLWVQGGHPGALETVLPGLPVGNYPITNEVTVAWAMGIARSFVPFVLWPWITLALTAIAGWAGLRALHVRPLARGLAVAALCSSPWLLAWQAQGSMTDPAALAWLVCAAALCALSRERPALLAAAVLAAGLSVGVKTTTAPLALFVLVLGLAAARGRLRHVRLPLAAGAAGALAVGGVWYLRNLIDHGSPFWPFLAARWGDARPHFIEFAKATFLARPAATVDNLGSRYLHQFGGGLLLLAGGILVPLAARARRPLVVAAATAAGLLIWANSPVTGVPHGHVLDDTVFSTTRYLLPVLGAAAVGLALVASERSAAAAVALATLGAVVVVNLVQTLELGFPVVPAVRAPLAGAAAGALAAVLAARAPRLRVPRIALPAGAVLAAATLAVPAAGFVARYGARRSLGSSPVVNRLAGDPAFTRVATPIGSYPVFIAALAGDRLDHRLERIAPTEPCPLVAARARRGWLVVYRRPIFDARFPLAVRRCLPGVAPAYEDRNFTVYRPLAR